MGVPPVFRQFAQQPVVKPGVAVPGHPEQHFAFAGWRFPIKRHIAPSLERQADLVAAVRLVRHVVGADGKIFDLVFRQRRHDAPGVSGHVGNHGGVDPDAVIPLHLIGEIGDVHQFFRALQAGQFAAIQRIQPNPAFFHGLDKGGTAFGLGIFQITVHGPKHFHVPLVTGAVGVICGLFGQFDALLEVAPLQLLHLRLQVRETDVHMRVGQQIDLERAHGFQRDVLFPSRFSLFVVPQNDLHFGHARRRHFIHPDVKSVQTRLERTGPAVFFQTKKTPGRNWGTCMRKFHQNRLLQFAAPAA